MKPLINHLAVNKNNSYLFFVMTVFLFIASSALAISGKTESVSQVAKPVAGQTKVFPPLPVLGKNTSYPVLSAQGVYVIDIDSGMALYEKNADAPLLPASTTKIITALVAMEAYEPETVLTVGREVIVPGQKMGLFPGEEISVKNLLYGLLVYSANDAAETLAWNFPGGYPAFIDAMNAMAKSLSMVNSQFDNPVGLDGDSQRSTAKDLVRASEVAMRNPRFAEIVGTKEIVLTDVSGRISYDLKNINQLLGVVPGVTGVKTGWTESARENLVTYIDRDNHRVLIALLGSQDRFGETKELIDWIFSNYQWTEVKYP